MPLEEFSRSEVMFRWLCYVPCSLATRSVYGFLDTIMSADGGLHRHRPFYYRFNTLADLQKIRNFIQFRRL